MAESTGLIHEIGAWTLDRACSDAREWQEEMETPVGVSVNVSGRQLDHPEFPTLVEQILFRTGLPPDLLELELTESSIMRRPDDATVTLHRLRALGIRIALDDFGTGHSSLAYLRRFPLDVLKIDRSFVHDLSAIDGNAVLLRSIIDLAHALDLRVVAEGVETPEQREILTRHGCDEIQGFLICSAVPLEQFAQGLATSSMTPGRRIPPEHLHRAR
jgi:EAL domain-containing protein (putative c-di-GMP-specific phosphodiesterase class I)